MRHERHMLCTVRSTDSTAATLVHDMLARMHDMSAMRACGIMRLHKRPVLPTRQGQGRRYDGIVNSM